MPCAAVPPRKAASSRSWRVRRPGTGMVPPGGPSLSIISAWVATAPPRPQSSRRRVEQVPPRVITDLVGEIGVAEDTRETDERVRSARGRMQREGFGVRHGRSPWHSGRVSEANEGRNDRVYPFSMIFTIAG